MMIEVKNHSKYHFRARNFQNFPGGHAPRPPRLSCYAAELPLATVIYFCHSPATWCSQGQVFQNFLGTFIIWPHHQLGSSYATVRMCITSQLDRHVSSVIFSDRFQYDPYSAIVTNHSYVPLYVNFYLLLCDK